MRLTGDTKAAAGGSPHISLNCMRRSEATRRPMMHAIDVLFPLAALLVVVIILGGGWR